MTPRCPYGRSSLWWTRPLVVRGGAKTRDEILPHPPATKAQDSVRQRSAATRAAPTVGTNWDGLGSGFVGPAGTFIVNSAPPDTNSAVGPTQVVETVNTSFAVFNKATGAATYGPAANNTLFSGFGGACQTTNDGDPVVRYDRLADRWVFTQFANVSSSTGPYLECVAVSQTSDATGAYYRYSFQYAEFPDYPKLSVWPDAYYVTYNTFSSNSFTGSLSCAMDRAKMLTGAAATQQCFSTGSSYGGLLPTDLDGAAPPPTGEPNLMIAMGNTNTSLLYWKFHVDWSTPANTTFTGPTSLTVAAYSPACGGWVCIPQPDTANQLDSLADRLMFRVGYRNFGDHRALVVTHAITAGSSAGIRWYELRVGAGGTPSVFQQGTYAPDASYRWMSSAAFDKAGNIGMGYSVGSLTVKPSLRATGRLAGDAAGTMTQGEASLMVGTGSQINSLTRWGDYASMSIDPSDDCTFWFTSVYLGVNGSFNWRTRNSSFRLPGCVGSVTNDFSISESPTSATVTAGSSTTTTVSTAITKGFAQTVALSASGLPTGVTASFSPSTVVSGSSSTLTIATSGATPVGTHAITITGTGASITRSTTYTLTVNLAGTVPGAPTAPVAKSGSTSGSTGPVAVSFKAPASSGSSAITGYTVTCTSTNLGVTRTATNAASPITVTALTTGKTYRCTVKATNASGSSVASVTSNTIIPGSPGAPTFVRAFSKTTSAATGSVVVSFIAGTTNGSAITGFKASCTSSDGGVTRSATAAASPVQVTGMTTAKRYVCTVLGINARGSGVPAAALPVVVGSPAPPTGITVVRLAAGSLRVSFTPGANNGAAITSFTAACRSTDGGVTKSAAGGSSPITVSALTATKSYKCSVTATNSRGIGLASATSATIIA